MALLSTAASCLAESELGAYKRAIYFSTPSLYGHYAPVFGLVCKMLGTRQLPSAHAAHACLVFACN